MNNELIKLPLWKNCLDEMRKQGIQYGQTFTAEFFEEHLKVKRDHMQFGLGVSEIRRSLERDGFYLSGRGQKGNQFVILPPSSNMDVMRGYAHKASDALARGVILGTNTRLDTLTPSERRKHESMLERMAIKAVLMARSEQSAKVIRKHNPELLSDQKRTA